MALSADIVARVSRRLVEHAGLELPAWVVEARTTARIAALDITPEAYLALIASPRGGDELAALVEAVRTGESSLFRHKSQFTAIADVVAPALTARGRRTVRVWSAGCAAGQEPYTLAAVLSRALPQCTVQILATDVSAEALDEARTATFASDSLDDVPEAYREDFVVDGDRVRVRPELTRLVRFERANLVEAAPARDFDLVWCRNVLIYFNPDARRRAIQRLVGATTPGGFLFVGHSESLRDVDDLEALRANDCTYYVRRMEVPRQTPIPELLSKLAAEVRSPGSFPKASKHAIVLPKDGADTAAPLPTGHSVLALTGTPTVSDLTAAIGVHLSQEGLLVFVIELDGAALLDDELAPVFRRALAVARGANITLELRALRAGPKRWLARHGLDDGTTKGPG